MAMLGESGEGEHMGDLHGVLPSTNLEHGVYPLRAG